MPKISKQLSERAVAAIKETGRHAVGGVQGLHLQIREAGAKAWMVRIKVGDDRRDFGLGSYPAVSLSQAREKARALREAVARGELPQSPTKQRKAALIAKQASAAPFAWCAAQYMAAKSVEWKNPKHRQQWVNTLEQYAFPFIEHMPVADIKLQNIMQILTQPQKEGGSLWEAKNETASRLRGRLEKVLDWATVSQYRTGENPARWRGHLEQLLPAPSKVQKIENHRALPWAELPAFMLRLKQSEGIAARALELLILTAARSGEIRGMRWDEVDLQAKVWTLPAHRMKAGRVHRVPLSNAAMRLLQAMPRIDDSPLVFPSPRGGALSDMSLTAVTRRMAVDCVPHGFRSSFRDWAGKMRFDPQITELCLSHKVKSETVGAYWREDALEWRTDIMQQWADYLDRPAKGGEVIAFKQARA